MKPVHASCIMQHLQRVLTSSAGRSCGAGRAAGPSRSGPRRTVAGVSRELTRSLAIDSYILHRASARYQNSRHGEKIHAIATGREHRWSGWAGLHRHRSTACRLTNHVVNADAGNQFIAPSSPHPSHMPLHLERPGGAETVARQQPWSNSAPPMSGVLDTVSTSLASRVTLPGVERGRRASVLICAP